MLTRADYESLISQARRGDDEDLARELEHEWNTLVAEKAAASARKRERTIRKKIESAWVAGIEACQQDGRVPHGLTKYELAAWNAGYYGQPMPQ